MPGGIARTGDILGPGGVLTAPANPNILVNGRPAALEACAYTPHPCCGVKKCPPTHCFGVALDIPSGVYFDGVPPLTNTAVGICGHKVMIASQDTFIVGGPLASVASLIVSRALLGGG